MIDRVIENWLTSINERSLESPFCQLLTGEGYQVVHLSRHGPFEEGKDILAIAPDGVPCAFQLKGPGGGKISLNDWAGFVDQIVRLVEVPIVHPSIDKTIPHRTYLVTNGELDEEVRLEIDHRNAAWTQRGYSKLHTIVKGQLLDRFKRLHTGWWPTELPFERALLEFFLADGRSPLPKSKLSNFIMKLLPLSVESPTPTSLARSLASAAIVTDYALYPFSRTQNHVAVIEGWTIYIACLTSLTVKHRLVQKYWAGSLQTSLLVVERALDDLVAELKTREHYVEGDPLVDSPFYRARLTWLVGFVALRALWQRWSGNNSAPDDWSGNFIRQHLGKLHLWGEAAMPQFLAVVWCLESIVATIEPDSILLNLIATVSRMNGDRHNIGLPDPYHGLSEVIFDSTGITGGGLDERFHGRSYTLETLVQLYARRGWRQSLANYWAEVSRIEFAEFIPRCDWEYCLWNVDRGKLRIVQPGAPQSWRELQSAARNADSSYIPALFLSRPELLLLFVFVFPHRLTKDAAKLLDDSVAKVRKHD